MAGVREWVHDLLVRPCVVVGPPLVIGVLIGDVADDRWRIPAYAALGTIALASFIAWKSRAPPGVRLATWILLGGAAGWARGQLEGHERSLRESWMRSIEGDARLSGVVLCSDRIVAGEGRGSVGDGGRNDGWDEAEVRIVGDRPFTVRMRARSTGPPLAPGEWIGMEGRLAAPEGPRNPGEADVRLAWRAAGIDARFAAVRVERIEALGTTPARVWVERLRARLGQSIDQACAPDTAGFLRALTLGLRRGIDPEFNGDLRRCGASHVIAVSGLHVALVLPVVWGLTALGPWSFRVRCVAVVAAVAILTILTGAQVPVVRCLVLVAVCLLGTAAGRRAESVGALAFSASFLALVEPAEVVRPSFQLTFGAVAALMILGRRLSFAFDEDGRGRSAAGVALGFVRSALTMSVAAWLATFPIVLFHFHQVSGVSSLANLWIIPAIFVATLFGYLLIVVGLLHAPAAAALGSMADTAYGWMAGGAGHFADSPCAFERMAFGPAWAWVTVAALVAVGLAVLQRRRGLGLLLLLCAPAPALAPSAGSECNPGLLQLHVVDVRRGSATLIEFPDGTWMAYDAGSLDTSDPGGRWIAPCAWKFGARRIGDIVISHPDADHLNGADFLIEAFHARRIWLSTRFMKYPGGAAWVQREAERFPDLEWRWIRPEPAPSAPINAWCTILPPPNWRARSVENPAVNDISLFVVLSNAGKRVLLTGDAETEGVGQFLDECSCGAVDLMVAPHHGKAFAGYQALGRLTPARVAVSAPRGYFAPEVIRAFRWAGANVDITGFEGEISYTIGPEAIGVRAFISQVGP